MKSVRRGNSFRARKESNKKLSIWLVYGKPIDDGIMHATLLLNIFSQFRELTCSKKTIIAFSKDIFYPAKL